MTSDNLARMESATRRIKDSGARLWTRAEIEQIVRQTLADALEESLRGSA